jgi:hypothetical protein
LLAACSVRVLRSWLPLAISALAVRMEDEDSSTVRIESDSWWFMVASARSRSPTSSARDDVASTVRLPAATAVATSPAR